MATPASATGSGVVPYRLTVRQFRKMIDANVFPDDARVELLGGVLVEMTTNEAHDYIVSMLAELLRSLLPAGCCLREEKSVQLGRYWRPQPDIAVLKGQLPAFARRSPKPADIGLLVEVADTSYPKDSGWKLRRYAAVRVPVYWIVNVAQAQVEVHHEPRGQGRRAYYHKVEIHDPLAQVPVVVDGQERGRIAVKDLFP